MEQDLRVLCGEIDGFLSIKNYEMRKLLNISGVTFLIIGCVYLISIPVIRKLNAIPESTFFTPTPYSKTKIVDVIRTTRLSYINEDSLLTIVDSFISNNQNISVEVNEIILERSFTEINDSVVSEYFVFEPKSVENIGIFLMGNGSNIFKLIDVLSELSKRNCTKIYVLNYSGYGFSQGETSGLCQLKTNQNFYDFVSSTDTIDFVMGHSLGSVFATRLAVDNEIESLILLSGISNINDLVKHFKSITNLFLRPYINVGKLRNSALMHSANNVENIKIYYGNLLLVHGTNDSNLPFFMAEKLLSNCPSKNKELVAIQGGGHNSPFGKDSWEGLIHKLRLLSNKN